MVDEFSLTGDEFSHICEAVTSFQTIRDMDKMLVAISDKLRALIAVEGVSIALHDPANKEFYFIYTIEEGGGEHAPREPLRFPDSHGVAGWVMSSMQPVTINDVSEDNRYFGGLPGKHDFITKSMICLPLKTRRGFIGVLYALNKLDGNFTPREQKIFEIVSGTIAVSIENGLLYDELTNNVRRLKEERRLLLSQVRSKSSFTSIIGSSPPMRQMFDLIEKVIDTSTTILIQGETGTGKELIAKVIHYNGPLKNKPFVAENCGALPETLLESELFGYVRGAFTGAHGTKKGLFEIADGGTIFLDEISEMPPAMQVKLLRVLQEGQFRPLGATRTVDVNVRIIASTNRDLSEEVTLGRFREDLYYRINVLKITPPPLRKRKEDILPLANHFLEKYATKHNRPVPILTPLTLDLLMEFDWPGNIRQLENEMERAVTVAGGSRTLYPDFLSEKLRQTRQGEAERNMPRQSTLKGAVGRLEARMIREALGRHGGNRSRVAKELGISRQGLLNKIAAYGLAAK